MLITLNSVGKGVLILSSVLLIISLISEGFIFNTPQLLLLSAIFLLSVSLYSQTKK